ncbi:MAG: glycosyltransferase family 4 protein [bacterium]|nr:glycosyltransferase family 4 protein [bacterium]
MLIHLVTDKFHLGGGLEHIFQIVRGFSDFRFRIFARPGEYEAVEKFHSLENVEIYEKGYEPGDVLAGKPDLVHIHHLKPFFSFFKHPFRKYLVPVIFTAHGLHIHKYEFYRSMRARLDYILRFQLEKRLMPRAETVIAVSREDKVFLEKKYRLGNVVYLTNGLDFSAVGRGEVPRRSDLRRKLDLPPDDFLFITVARFHFQKGYDILIKAVSMIKDFIKKHRGRFVLVGDGPEWDTMKQLSLELGLSDHIIFTGARTDVYDILKAGDVFLLPSRWEGLPIVLLETALLKLPVIASDTYGNREIIKQSNGILFNNLDSEALAAVIKDVLERKFDLNAYSENLFKEVQANYSLEKMLSGLREIYQHRG